MSEQSTYKIFIHLIVLMFVTGACGTSSQTQSQIATSVAQTVQAQNSLTKVAALPTDTPVPPVEITSTPELNITDTPTAAGIANPGCVASANLIGENPPDKTLFQPGEYFYKTWTFLNTGTCAWDQSYSLVFWSGDLMGGLTSYAIPELVAPNGTVNISIYLQAPATEGLATGFWRFQTPWGTNFGVGSQDAAFYAQVAVSTKPKYGITNVQYTLARDPVDGCPVNVRYTVYATVTANGPVEFSYYWDQSDGNESGMKSDKFKEAGSKSFQRDWLINKGDSQKPRWVQFVLTGSQAYDYGKVIIDHFQSCP